VWNALPSSLKKTGGIDVIAEKISRFSIRQS